MPFIPDARALMQTLPQTDPLRLTLEYLLINGIGRVNAVPIDDVVNFLTLNAISITREQFQQTILHDTRQGSIFIASSKKGVYLIDSIDDAIEVRDFYQTRIDSMQANLDNLRNLARANSWNI